MENLSIILGVIGLGVFIFSYWSFQLLKKHLKQFNGNYRHSSSLTDEKYYELKSKQDYILAISAIIFALLSFVGYTSISNIKKELSAQIESEKKNISSLNDTAKENLSALRITGKSYEDSVRSALELVTILKNRIGGLLSKDVIKQDIYIVDPLSIGNFPIDKTKPWVDANYRVVRFSDLTTISGQKLPAFKTPPSIVCFSKNSSMLMVDDITNVGFKIRPDMMLGFPGDTDETGNKIKFSLWISQKPNQKEFTNEFSDEFK